MRKAYLCTVLLVIIIVCFTVVPAMARGGGDENFPDAGISGTNNDVDRNSKRHIVLASRERPLQRPHPAPAVLPALPARRRAA